MGCVGCKVGVSRQHLDDFEYASCKSCGCPSYRRRRFRRGYCGKCEDLPRRLREVEAWDFDKPQTLKRIPRVRVSPTSKYRRPVDDPLSYPITYDLNRDEFAIWKDEHIRQLDQHLSRLRICEEERKGQHLDGLTLERKFAAIQRAIAPKEPYPSNASAIRHKFNDEQLRFLYCLLDDIEEPVPVRRIVDIQKALDRISEHRRNFGWS
jgi:hypothetical protein